MIKSFVSHYIADHANAADRIWEESFVDALDILTDPENVIPFFQAIFNAEEHRIIGYEILGRFRTTNGEISLGPFFQDETIPEEYRIEVDNIVLTKALEIAAKAKDSSSLWFVNRDASLLLLDNGEQFLQLILKYKEKGILPEQIVLEISESKDEKENEQIGHLLSYFKAYGIKIAIDKIGNERTHLDRISELVPEILKIDMSTLRSNTYGSAYLDVLHSIAILARKIGATLLFENIETAYQLQFAWKNGGRFYQGFYLKKPTDNLIDKNILKEKFKSEFQGFIISEKKRLQSIYELRTELNSMVHERINRNKKVQNNNELLMILGKEMDGIAFRMYICDEEGFQKSSNIIKKDGAWTLQAEYEGKNWSWRPYFLENIIRMKVGKKGILSDRYSDIETGETIRTFSHPVNEKEFLFIDLSSSYLFEREGLF